MSRLGSFSPPTENAHHEAGSDNRSERVNAKNRFVRKVTLKKTQLASKLTRELKSHHCCWTALETTCWKNNTLEPSRETCISVISQHLAYLPVRILSETECPVGDFAHLHWTAENKQLVPENLDPDSPETWIMGRNSIKWLTLWTIRPKTCRASVLCCVTWLRDKWKSSCRE